MRRALPFVAWIAVLSGCPKNAEPDTAVVSTITQMGFIDKQIALFASDEHRAPTAREGLAVVFDGTTPKDAWGNAYKYIVPGPDGRAYDLVSYGADGKEGGRGSAGDLVWSDVKKTQPASTSSTGHP